MHVLLWIEVSELFLTSLEVPLPLAAALGLSWWALLRLLVPYGSEHPKRLKGFFACFAQSNPANERGRIKKNAIVINST